MLYDKAFVGMIDELTQANPENLSHLVTGLDGSARSIAIAQLFQKQAAQYLIVEPRSKELTDLYEDLNELLPQVPVLLFPAEESLAVEFSMASKENSAQRVQVLNTLRKGQNCIILTSTAGLKLRLSPIEVWDQALLSLELGQEIDLKNLESRFNNLGYRKEALVQAPGEYSVRGGIVDFYPLDQDYPVRLDFFDIELDSIRTFDPETQLSQGNLSSVELSPVHEIIFPVSEQKSILSDLKIHLDKELARIKDADLRQKIALQQDEQLHRLEEGEPLKNAKAYLSFWDSQNTSLLDYFNGYYRFIVMEYGRLQQQEFQMIEENQFWIEHEIIKGQLMPNLEIQLNASELIRYAEGGVLHFSLMQRGLNAFKFKTIYTYQYRSMNRYYQQMPLISADLNQYLKENYVVQITALNKKSAYKILNDLEQYQVHPVIIQEGAPLAGAVNIQVLNLSNGFELSQLGWVVVTEQELFDSVKRRKSRNNHLSNAERIKNYNELEIGDYVVHVNHGIGKYSGIETMEINGNHRDLIAIEYQDQARVLIPVDEITQLQKYVASESRTPKINKLGGGDWAKTKQKVQKQIEDIADELIELYAKRENEKGFAYSPDTPEQDEFEEAFPYIETEDQLQSIQEIKADMEKDRPMDRLLVGDVGYGKTEVAMRAIFKAIIDGKQVAFLVPTTILAQQHYNTLVERFASWPFEIGLLSRFVSAKDQRETIKQLKLGSISVVVGTHRLLSKDVEFNDLGLLIIDEEQRFGVKHKERLKQLRSQVDVLTLTATPIPRTLHMSMTGVRDLSLIETPPNNRFPVQTYVMERNEGVIKSGIERELARDGQVFYLYNRVATIERRAMEIGELVPDARIAIAHGQMPENQLEQILLDFISGDYDVLVTTTIIETGVDITNVNTLFVEDADRMGLSTLYQLRGRVGRTHRLAYAYLMYKPFKQLSEVSEKRLNAVREFTDLGSGFKLAMRDLSIRGAGNLLGQQQSGFIDSVGYDLYTEMLKEAVDQRKGLAKKSTSIQSQDFEWQVSLDAYIPSEYIDDERQKIGVYKTINRIDSLEAYRDLQEELIDRFGEFPDPVSDLLDIALIKHYSQESGIYRISRKRQDLFISFNEAATEILKGVHIFKALEGVPNKAQINLNHERLEVSLNIYNQANDQWLQSLIKFTQQASEIIKQERSDA